MDSDRKSAVSSFYGGRRGSFDALNNDFSAPAPQYATTAPSRPRADSSSSFYANRPSRASNDVLNGGSAGYNRMSFFDAGRAEPLKGGRDEEEEAMTGDPWDVYADFNNAGPRYSTAFGIPQRNADAG